jgi:hypothetical protein
MNIRFLFIMCLVLTTGLVLAQEPAGQNWKLFKSTAGFSVKYPSNWSRKRISTDSLSILSSRGGAEAVIIKGGQAMINVVKEEEKYTSLPLSQLVERYVKDTVVLSRKNIHNELAGTHGCHDLLQIISREPLVPLEDVPVPSLVPYMINTDYFCEIHGHKYVTALRNYDGDKRQATYRQVALRIAESLRIN